MTEIAPEVLKGAALLDEKLGPGWDKRVATSRLNIASCRMCVLGQLFGDYEEGLRKLRIRAVVSTGFCPGVRVRASTLTNGWRELIRLRRKARREAA